jgi:hypothetical protein
MGQVSSPLEYGCRMRPVLGIVHRMDQVKAHTRPPGDGHSVTDHQRAEGREIDRTDDGLNGQRHDGIPLLRSMGPISVGGKKWPELRFPFRV